MTEGDGKKYNVTYAGTCDLCDVIVTIIAFDAAAYDQKIGDPLFQDNEGVLCKDCDGVARPVMVGAALSPWVTVHETEVSGYSGVVL